MLCIDYTKNICHEDRKCYQLKLNHADSTFDAGTGKNLRYRSNRPHVIVLFLHTRSKFVAQSEYDMCISETERQIMKWCAQKLLVAENRKS
jgi:hypothetical protein